MAAIRQQGALVYAIDMLKLARDALRDADCPKALAKVRSALSSAEGAERHMRHRLNRTEVAFTADKEVFVIADGPLAARAFFGAPLDWPCRLDHTDEHGRLHWALPTEGLGTGGSDGRNG